MTQLTKQPGPKDDGLDDVRKVFLKAAAEHLGRGPFGLKMSFRRWLFVDAVVKYRRYVDTAAILSAAVAISEPVIGGVTGVVLGLVGLCLSDWEQRSHNGFERSWQAVDDHIKKSGEELRKKQEDLLRDRAQIASDKADIAMDFAKLVAAKVPYDERRSIAEVYEQKQKALEAEEQQALLFTSGTGK